MKESVLDMTKKKVGDVDLDDAIFGVRSNQALIYEVVKMQRAGQRRGTASTKEHSDVSGTTAKMYRQKGTGRARHGDSRTNIFVGGGQCFGPKPKDWSYRIPRKARRGGIRVALSDKAREGKLLIVEKLEFPKIKTKDAVAVLSKLGVASGLVVLDGRNETVERSLKNVPGVSCLCWEGLNVYDIVRHEHTVITRAALDKLQEVLKP